jgi:hypothetical protein
MEKSVSISNKVDGLDTVYYICETEFNLKIKYEHPKIKLDLTISDEELYYYSYEGSIESLLKYNNVLQTIITAEYFILSLDNINCLRIGEYSATFRFPLQVNFINYIIEVRCDKKLLSVVQNENLMKEIKSIELKTINKLTELNETLTKKIVKLENKCSVLETRVNNLNQLKEEYSSFSMNSNIHLDLTISFEDEEPIIFNENITSLNLTLECKQYKHKIILPKNLLIFKMTYDNKYDVDGTNESPISIQFPDTLIKLSLCKLVYFNQFIDFKSMRNIKEINLEYLPSFNQAMDLPDTVESFKFITVHYTYTHLITIPKSVKFAFIGNLKGMNFMNYYPIKCYSTNKKVVEQLYRYGLNKSKIYFPIVNESLINNFLSINTENNLSENVSFF